MGVAVLSGIIDNLSSPKSPSPSSEDSAPSTPMGSLILDPNANPASLPDRYISLFLITLREEERETKW